MFSLKVVDTDMFLDMSPSAQNLYFHLGMRADDDGFVSSPKKIMVMVNAAENDYQILVVKGFIIPMSTNGVCVVTHWKTNNLIKSDRYTETEYKEEKDRLIEVDGKYTFEHLLTERQRKSLSIEPYNINGSKMVPEVEPQVRLGKDNTIALPSQSEFPSYEEWLDQEKITRGFIDNETLGEVSVFFKEGRKTPYMKNEIEAMYNKYVKGLSPKKEDPRIQEVLDGWNKYSNFQSLKISQKPPNPSVSRELLPPCQGASYDLKRIIKAKLVSYTVPQFQHSFKEYVKEIINRNADEKGYYLHRMSLYDFIYQKNGFTKYANR